MFKATEFAPGRDLLAGITIILLLALGGATVASLAGCTDATEEIAEAQELPSEARMQEAWIATEPWYRELLCELLLNNDPQIRVLASLAAEKPLVENDAPLECPAPLGVIDPAAIRREIAREASNQPAILARIYSSDCGHRTEETGCDASLIRRQLLQSDPENAYVHLLTIPGERSENDVAGAFTEQERQHLLAAANARRFDWYWGAGIYDAYLAFKALMPGLPPCPMDDLLFNGGKNPTSGGNCLDMVSLNLLLSANSATPGHAPLQYQGCKTANEQNDTEVVEACFQVADLMRDTGRTHLVTTLGTGLRRALERPEFTGANRELQDPERWRMNVRVIEFQCRLPKGLFLVANLPGAMPDGHFASYLQDLQEATEDIAVINAAKREYAAYPDAFIVDPGRCADIYMLDEAVQRQLADDLTNYDLTNYSSGNGNQNASGRILNDLAQALNSQTLDDQPLKSD